MFETYSWDDEKQTLTVFSNMGVKDYCEDNEIDLGEYDYKTVIDPSVTDCSEMFYKVEEVDFKTYKHTGCSSFNQPIVIPDGVTDCSYMFACCKSYNQPTTFPDSVEDCTVTFGHCRSFDSPVTMSKNVKYCRAMFSGCESLNQPIVFPDAVEDCSCAFRGCQSLDQPIVVPDCVTDKTRMFENCEFINDDGSVKKYADLAPHTKRAVIRSLAEKAVQKSYLGKNVELSSRESELVNVYKKQKAIVTSLHSDRELVMYKTNYPNTLMEYDVYNKEISDAKVKYHVQNNMTHTIDSDIKNTIAPKSDTQSANSTDIPKNKTFSWDEKQQTLTVFANTGVKDYCHERGLDVSTYNYKTIIDASVNDCSYMFADCKSYNQVIGIPDGVENCSYMFEGCKAFNQSVFIPATVTDCESMFQCCLSLNQRVYISDGVTNCRNMFDSCRIFNQPISVPNNATDCAGMFTCCESFNQPIFLPDGVTNCCAMFQECRSFNQPIFIPDSVKDCSAMFDYCKSFNQPIEIPDAYDVGMFYGSGQRLSQTAHGRGEFEKWSDFEAERVFAADDFSFEGEYYKNFYEDEYVSRDDNGDEDGENYVWDEERQKLALYSGKSYENLSCRAKNVVINSLAEKVVQKSYLKQEVELSPQESEFVSVYKRQKALYDSFGGDEVARSYEAKNPGAFIELDTYGVALCKAKVEHAFANPALGDFNNICKHKTDKFDRLFVSQGTNASVLPSDKQYGD